MVLEIFSLIYVIAALGFFIAMTRDQYVDKTKAIIIVYIAASLFWPLTGLLYLLDDRK
jgi:hypothetical protein